MNSHMLTDAAFGPEPGRWPLPTAQTADQLWLRAVAAGGQGRYDTARADLAELVRREPVGWLASLALSTQASFLRQTGWHALARGWDGRAWALAQGAQAGGDPECGLDAVVGLAADALGMGRFSASAALLKRAEDLHLHADEPPARLAIRLAWVRAELAMVTGDGPAAVAHARRGVDLAEAALPEFRRHRVKSNVVLAAALCCSGDLAGARQVADAALDATSRHGLVPLHWAASCLLADIGSSVHGPAEVAAARDRSDAFVTRHGGRWNRR